MFGCYITAEKFHFWTNFFVIFFLIDKQNWNSFMVAINLHSLKTKTKFPSKPECELSVTNPRQLVTHWLL